MAAAIPLPVTGDATKAGVAEQMALAGVPELPRTYKLWSATADPCCQYCKGSGSRLTYNWKLVVCGCVLRNAFRACLDKYRYCERFAEATVSDWVIVTLFAGGCNKRDNSRVWERQYQDYAADFYLVAKRNLCEADWKLFQLHMLSGLDWKTCADKLGINRGNFFHSVYRIERRLGRVFMELEPYALFPLCDYFHSSVKRGGVQ